jgi:hypothetical protein
MCKRLLRTGHAESRSARRIRACACFSADLSWRGKGSLSLWSPWRGWPGVRLAFTSGSWAPTRCGGRSTL